ncbi:polysaccharide biosynthesis protein [Halalkalibacterium halodurans]|uniref:Spore cortex protein n=1 Tax=Halalkalibacterium halodurans (strain ATCC BAA-125 / DSM 18197 / FERM 7344 / JCM 9153 / C-125) TaxID=272558 RepID=Q9K7T2_HALH5|nr:polysaccharide biosynthesis protein [Halalkalibacterium halodurans]MED4079970.1 polysaccharide biosynthesis protein [Halalkalibacterium halodurans]MED4084458.1 polysaccharide biosynthesis protein [Halalkalibacterium halodurans]MED4104946.1 polysaccharide biosynthesis protein [Halalkalibacterium halodurans]MED4107413.1 polysaccharide biosynthesis protein [Halalkalibacterium halodurans]MED4125703.1 polysaccharide biosynthesis protein [Halalkalibacterium halodurans]
MGNSKLVRGTMVLTAATLISKILGFIYVIPFTALVGTTGLALYQFGYSQYVILLSLATMGVPLAVSKFVAKYQSLGDYETGYRLFRSGVVLMTITGTLSFLALFFAAPFLANVMNPGEEDLTQAEVILSIRMVSVALIVVPAMSIIRGYFQGYQSMGPTAVSQVVEQIVRIVFILGAAFTVLNVLNGDMATAVGFATFAAFVGAIGGLAVLAYYWFKRRKGILEQVEKSTVRHNLTLKDMYKELILYALPLSFVGLAIPLFQFVDTYTIKGALIGTEFESISTDFIGVLTQAVHKVVLIPMALATALSVTLIPTITRSFTDGDMKKLKQQTTQTFQIILFIAIPAAVGMAVLAYPIYGALYFENLELGGNVMRYYGPITLCFSLFAVSAALLQGINRQRMAVIALIVGLLIKLVTNVPFLHWFGPNGVIFSSYLGNVVAIGINIWAIAKYGQFDFRLVAKRTLLITVFALIMGGAVYIVTHLLSYVINATSRGDYFILTFVGVTVGAAVYLYLSYRSNLAGRVLGERFSILKRKGKSQG